MRAGVAFPPVVVHLTAKITGCRTASSGSMRQGSRSSRRFVRRSGLALGAMPSGTASRRMPLTACAGVRPKPKSHPACIAAPQVCQAEQRAIAKHFHVSEPTVRYLRKRLSSHVDEDGVRLVTRGGTTYELNARKIGTNSKGTRPRSRHSLRVDLAAMKENSSAAARPLLVIIEHWLLGQSESARCLDAIERFLHGQHTGSAT